MSDEHDHFEEKFWTSPDGLKLHFRDYAGPGTAEFPPVVCLPGLTRNSRDFEEVADHLRSRTRVICPTLRGRGDSDYAPDSATYVPQQYAADLLALFEQEGIERAVFVGTSLGGILTMLLAALKPELIAGALINDIGPEISDDGIARIRGYVGQGGSFPTWMHAARALEEGQGDIFPHYTTDDWLVMAKRSMTVGTNQRICPDYDAKIAEPFAGDSAEGGTDLWGPFEALGTKPLVAVRGESSDILSADTLAAMQAKADDMEVVIVPGVGHAPFLDDAGSLAALDRLLDRAKA
jgi:pimeloyl-ACP methyl ester carboxylesterase